MPALTRSAHLSSALRADSTSSQAWLRRALSVISATALLALSAHISVSLPFTPIPVTLQTFAVLLIAMLFGPVWGSVTMLLYLAEGAVGLPVFSPHGLGGLPQLVGPSAGYLLSYPFAALLAGSLFAAFQRFVPTFFAAAAAACLADMMILVAGSAWLSVALHLTPAHALQLGATPFLAGEALKMLFVSLALSAFQKAR